jgi:hypothetical protein
MPSAALLLWQNDRNPRLAQVDAQCDAVLLLAPPNPTLAEESLRGYTMHLSAHFQGFCRDLYTECSQILAAAVPARLQPTVQRQFSAKLELNKGNPTVQAIKEDYGRFDFTLDFDVDPANALRVTHLDHLNRWRNVAAHQKRTFPPGVPLDLPGLRAWRTSCDGLATWLDATMY